MNNLENNKDTHLKEKFYHRLALLVVFFFVAIFAFRYIQTKDFQVATGLKSGAIVPIQNESDYKIIALVGDTVGQHTSILTSKDGKIWSVSETDAPWSPKSFQATQYFKGAIFMAGGYNPDVQDKNNHFWKSDNGENWTLPSLEIPWESRTGSGFISFKDKLWIMGGVKFDNSNIKFFSDIWNSVDGITWEKITDTAPWGKRDIRELVVFENKLWIFGGSVINDQNFENFITYSDVWVSTDGIDWQKKTVPWQDEGISGAFSIGGSLFVLVGDAFNSDIKIYRTDDEENWSIVAPDVPFRAYNFEIVNSPYSAFVIGGSADESPNKKVWKTNDGIHWSLLGETPIDIGEGMPVLLVPNDF